MKKVKIVGWTHFDSDYPTLKLDSDGLNLYLELISKEIKKKRYYFSGEEHQNSATGVPVFSDGTCFRASMRAWGSIMAKIYLKDNNELTYMDFYMSTGKSKLPKYKNIKVKPAIISNLSLGCTLKEDRQLIAEAKALGMMFMTTDKVLKKLAEEA